MQRDEMEDQDQEEFPGRLLHQAALWENVDLLEDLLNGDHLELVNSKDSLGRTALHAAAAQLSHFCTRILLQAGADPAIACCLKCNSRTPLHVAAEHGRVDNIKLLLEWKADLLTKDRNGLTPLDIADQCGNEECMAVLKHAADEQENSRCEAHQALLESCSRGDITKMRLLLKELRNETNLIVNSAPNGSNTLLFKASEEGQKEIVKLLLDNGADGRIHPVTKYSPLYIACFNGRKDIAEILLKRFPQLVNVSTVERWLPIHAATINGHVTLLDALLRFPYPTEVMKTFRDKTGALEYQLPFDINAPDVTGQTVLYIACYVGNLKLVDLLLKFKVKAVKVDSIGSESQTTVKSNNSFVEEVERKNDVGAIGGIADTSPKRRLSGGIQMIMSKLNLNKNGGEQQLKLNEIMFAPLELDVYCVNNTETALHAAVKHKHHSIVSLLLASGANPNFKINVNDDDIRNIHEDDCTFTGSTALVEACKNRDYGMIELLLKHGARDDECKSLAVAVAARDEVTISKLLALKTHPDPEYKINKKAMDVLPVTQFGALAFTGVGSVTYSSMYPTVAVMVNWHGQRCLDHIREQWCIDASIAHNTKLKLNVKNQCIALYAITRLDISNNAITELPKSIFQLASLRHLNAAQNKIERLPNSCGKLSLVLSPQHKTKSSSVSTEESYDCPVLEEIHLQDNRLDSVPSALFALPALATLDLSNNKLQSLPFQVWTAPKLRELNVSFNLLSTLPIKTRTGSEVGALSKDVVDNRSSNEGDKSPRLSTTPESGFRFVKEQRNVVPAPLNGGGVVDFCSDGVKFCVGEEAVEEKRFVLKQSTSSLSLRTKQMQHCNFWSRSIEVNDSILDEDERNKDNLSQLSTLNLAHNSFDVVPIGLSCLAVNLTRLNLSYNSLSDIGQLCHYPIGLKQLDLSHNHINTWPALRRFESDLHSESQDLYCYNCLETSPKHTNKAVFLPLRKLNPGTRGSSSSLTSLGPAFCVHRRHQRLDNLRTLIMADNELDKLVISIEDDSVVPMSDEEEFQEAMENKDTNRENRKCSSPTPSVKSKLLFPNLSMLDISNNQLAEIPTSISDLSNLSVLNLSGNSDITHLPPEMGLLSKLWNLNTRGCNLSEPLKNMIDSKRYKTMDVVGYLKSIIEDAKPYARMKLMIVGIQGIGKTSLLEQLRQEGTGTYKKKPAEHWAKRMGNKNINLKTAKGVNISTVGVDIGDWMYEKKIRGQSSHGPVTFRTWDFGGQKEYYATHQYFLSRRSLYLVVWKITDGERGVSEIQQWLVNIQARAPNSPVLIVGTHYDLVKEKYPPLFSEDLQQLIRNRFINVVDADKCGLPRVLDTIEISCKTRHNIKLLCNLIYDTVFELRSTGSKERLLEQHIPATYLALEDVVAYLAVERRLKNKDPVLQSEQYKMLVMHEMQDKFHMVFRDMAELNQATAFLHENGVLLHYEDATLKDLYFLDPQWLCDMLAHVVTIREINPFARNGIMKMDDLKHSFKSSQCAPTDAKHYIINLLNKFEVALTWDNRTLLIPSLLPTEEQMRSGLPGCDVRIPVRSRGWVLRNKTFPIGSYKGGGSPKKTEDVQEAPFSTSSYSEDCHIQHHFDPHASIRRLLIMSYFPSGFWSRLITRILADDNIVEIIRSYFVLPKEVRQDHALLSLLEKRAEWVCWQTGIELRYANTSLFRMKEILLDVSNVPCDYRRMRFMLQQEGTWSELDLSTSAILEVLLTNQTIVLKRPFPTNMEDDVSTEGGLSDTEDIVYQSIALEPNPECVTKLLSLAVDHIDTLLEDWYPTLGTRFVHTSEGKFLVTRVVPCTPCLVSQFRSDYGMAHAGSSGESEPWNLVDIGGIQGEPCVRPAPVYIQGFTAGGIHNDRFLGNLSPGRDRRVGNRQNQGSRDSTMSHDSDSGVGPDSNSSSRKPSAEGRQDVQLVQDQDQQMYEDTDAAAVHLKLVYSFMIEECILTAYEENCVRCPAHGGIPLAQIAPDTVFLDLGERYLVRPETIKRGKMLGRGAFGFVFRATVKQRASNTNVEVAMKMLQPVDPGYGARQSATAAYKAAQSKWQRDPIQYGCKAYCTARQELGILLSLRHTNIVPLVGMCTHPLSLVLELAPQGALDTVLKNYRRSGAKLGFFVLKNVIIQIAKALEYLHSQHIIYRDLKSENVLVWKLPPPFQIDPLEPVDVKLADYGISRSTLPSGSKGFGGTEGFMAPEIMRYNGEEEYTEKVDCFSFGMFLYELLTLHLPFDGHESVKDYILEGGRPTLSQREIMYPTYVLDLMCLCWSQHPKDRPSASQIVSIATAPEFVHLVDVALLNESLPVICGAVVRPNEQNNEESSNMASNNQSEVWLSRRGKQIDVVSCTLHGWQDYKTLDLDMITVSRICVVFETIWLGDSKGRIHIYSASKYAEMFSFPLEPDVSNPSAVNSIQHNPVTNVVAISLVNGRLWLCKVDWLIIDAPTDTTITRSLIELGTNGLPIHCTATIFAEGSPVSELWCGQSNGQITIFTLHDAIVTSQDVIGHNEAAVDALDVLQIVTDVRDHSSVWSYVYPGCVVYHWDTETHTIINKLDCSKLAPCSESLKSISIEEHLSPGRCQVTSMAVLNGEIYIGTTWGCIVVSEGKTMRPITIFRPFEEEVKVILPLMSSSTATTMTKPREMISKAESPLKEKPQLRSPGTTTPTSFHIPPTILTVGKGYRNLIGRFTNFPTFQPPNVDRISSKKNIVSLLWRSEHWVST